MKSICCVLALAISLFLTAANAEQAIDCTNTKDLDEQIVCNDYTLSNFDAIALRLYEAGVTQRPNVQYFHVWRDHLKRGRQLCKQSKECIELRYKENISSIAKLLLNGDNIGSAKGYWIVAGTGLIIQDRKGFQGVERSEALAEGMPVDLRSNVGSWWKVKLLTSDFEGYVYAGGNSPLPLKFVEYTEEMLLEDNVGDVNASSETLCPTKRELQSTQLELEQVKQSMQRMMAENANGTAANSDSNVVNEDCKNLQKMLDAANSALADKVASADAEIEDIRADVAANYVARSDFEAKVKEVEALNAAITNLKEQTTSETVPRKDFEAQAAKLEAANQALADLNRKISTDFVAKEEFLQKAKEVDALNSTLATLKASVEKNYVERAVYESDVSTLAGQVAALNSSLTQQKADADAELANQVGALNSTIVDMQTRTETMKRRLSEVGAALNSFVQECKANKECADIMVLP